MLQPPFRIHRSSLVLCRRQRYQCCTTPRTLPSQSFFHSSRQTHNNHSTPDNTDSSSQPPKVGRLIILRHGQSEWNAGSDKSEARFTGWANIGLTELGRAQATAAAELLGIYLRNQNIPLDCAFVSLLDRAKDTLNLILQELQLYVDDPAAGISYPKIPVTSSWRLNERHYGALVGQSKSQAEQMYSKEMLGKWRYSWTEPPPPMDEETLAEWIKFPHCRRITYLQNPAQNELPANPDHWTILEHNHQWSRGSDDQVMPASEAFGNVLDRLLPLWERAIAPRLAQGQTVLVVGHANTMKSLLHILDPKVVNPDTVANVKIPNTTPLVYEMGATNKEEDDPHALPGGIRVLAERPHFWALDAPMMFEPRHALRGLWLERGYIPADEQGKVLFSFDQPPPSKRFVDPLDRVAQSTPSTEAA